MSPEESRALQVALFSLLPGLGQLINKRADKAIAFFVVNALNVVLVTVFARIRVPYLEFYESEWARYMHYWQVGSAPFAILMFLIAGYVSYAMYDAYKDALFDLTECSQPAAKSSPFAVLRAIEPAAGPGYAFNKRWRTPLLSLSLITCLSYIAHLGTIMLTCFLVLLKVFPLDPVVHEQAIEFVIADLDNSPADRHNGQGERFKDDERKQAHSPDPIKEQVSASRKASEAGNRIDDTRKDASTKETEQISSKEIITPDTKQSPQETRSLGSSANAIATTKTANSETQNQPASASNQNERARTSQNERAIQENGKLASVQPSTDLSRASTEHSSRDPLNEMSNPSQAFARGGMATLAEQSKLSNSSSNTASPAFGQMSQANVPVGASLPDPTQRAIEPASFISMSSLSSQNNASTGMEKAVSIAMLPGNRAISQTTATIHAPGMPQRGVANYTTYDGTIDNSISGDSTLSPVWNKYFQSFQQARRKYQGEMLPGRAEAELVFDSNGAPVSYNIKNESSPAAESLREIIAGMDMSALPGLPGKFAGKLTVKVGIIHSGKHTIGTFDMSPNKTFGARPAVQASNPSVNQAAKQSAAGDTSDSRSPSMLGFMDESLSSDPSMQHFWSEYSKVLSHVVRDRATPFSNGATIASFAVDRNGEPLQVKLTNPQSDISRELSKMLSTLKFNSEKLPTLPANHAGKTYMAVKVSTKNEKPFVSVEIQPTPIQLNSESLTSFENEAQLQAYLQDLKKVIYRSWNPRSKEGSKPVMVGFHIATNGKLTNHKIVQSSGDPETDKAALDAALAVTDWVAPPAGTEEDLDISMVIQNCTPCDETKTGENAHKKRITLPALTNGQEASTDSRWAGF